MAVGISAIYAGVLALVGVALQQHVGRERLRAGISLYDGGDERLAVAMRRQANFVEQVPLALLLLVILELNGASALWLHVLGASLLTSRVLHPFGLDMQDPKKLVRLLGALLTLVVVVAAAVMAIVQGV